MCGIIGYTGKNAVPTLIKGLEMLEYRGYDSAGIALTQGNKIHCVKREGKLQELKKAVDLLPYSDTGIGHTRWATHGKPSESNAHPHLSGDGKFAIVHNGIIENFSEIRSELSLHGVRFVSQTDSEVIAHLLALHYRGDVLSTLKTVTGFLKGSYALAVLCSEHPDSIYFTARSSPLTVAVCEKGCFVSSDPTALSPYTKEAYRLNDGEMGEIRNGTAEITDADGNRISYEQNSTPVAAQDADKGGYAHYMLKEIYEQPTAVRDTCFAYVKGDEIFPDGFGLPEEKIKNISRLYLTGCGSAYHVCLTGKYVFEQLLGIPTEAVIASEFRYGSLPLTENTPVFLISQSGETADTLAALRLAKKSGAPTVGIVNCKGSTMDAESDFSLYTHAGRETAVATTKAYSAQLVLIYLTALYLGRVTGKVNRSSYGILLESILSLPVRIRSALTVLGGQMQRMAEKIAPCESVFFIGRNLDYPCALEASLKLKEVSYLHSEALPAGELKHGTISLIHEKTPVIALCCNDGTLTKTISNVREVISRGARVICVTDSAHKKECEAFCDTVSVPVSHPITAASLEIIPMQLLSYYTALRRNCDIDQPRNLAKSVTVE